MLHTLIQSVIVKKSQGQVGIKITRITKNSFELLSQNYYEYHNIVDDI